MLTGDFFQLKPVVSSRDKSTFLKLFSNNPKGFAFLSSYWSLMKIKTVCLNQVIRQSDKLFVDALCKIREGECSGLDYVNANCRHNFYSDAVTLMGKNASADSMNEKELLKINSRAFSYDIYTLGELEPSDIICVENLILKVGARVMFIANSMDGEYYNGDMGIVTALSESKIYVFVDRTGRNIVVLKCSWEVFDYVLDDNSNKLVKKTVGMYVQYPLRLGWAITVHKSQGQTFDKVNLYTEEYWDEGQLYVALSRCRSVKNVCVQGNISYSKVKASKEVSCFYTMNELGEQFDSMGI